MTDQTPVHAPRRPLWFSSWIRQTDDRAETIIAQNRHAASALERHKREGVELAVRARTIAMLVIAVFVGIVTPWPAATYYMALIVVFILIGLAQQRVSSVGHNRWELVLLFCDLALMTIICVVPNPFDDRNWPLAFQYRFETFIYFFVFLAGATLAYTWRTIITVGVWTAALWMLALIAVWQFQEDSGPWRAAAEAKYPNDVTLTVMSDPSSLLVDLRLQGAMVFLIVAGILAVTVRRFNLLLLDQAGLERERANLARYFSPNVVDQLSHNDEPLKQVRTQDIAVLFADIVGFTSYAAHRSPEEVIDTLRRFHASLEAEVFRHNGTLDKYLGDGLMATFGTPVAGPEDAVNAIRCARAMCAAIDRLNTEREAAGEQPLRVGVGVHYGPAVLGDIGGDRLEYAVIGNTVNIASRIEALTRSLAVRAAVSDAAVLAAQACPSADASDMAGFKRRDGQEIRGVDETMTLWTLE
ncbi:MAG: adenylate/guanylate cyclase domain-containing protein [Pseudomonadota bacterium]